METKILFEVMDIENTNGHEVTDTEKKNKKEIEEHT